MKNNSECDLIVADERSPYMHQALEQVLTEEVASGNRNPTIRFWEDAEENVMLGRFQSVENEVWTERVERDGVKICRRITGGGAMYTEPRSQITYSLYLPEEMVESDSIKDSYSELDEFAVEGLKDLGYDVYYEPVNDICTSCGKVGGAAQTRFAGAVLHHTRLAYDLDPEKMVNYLRIGEEKMSDKAVKSAERAVDPLKVQNPNIERDKVLENLLGSLSDYCDFKKSKIKDKELKKAEKLVSEKFGAEEWIYRY